VNIDGEMASTCHCLLAIVLIYKFILIIDVSKELSLLLHLFRICWVDDMYFFYFFFKRTT